MAGSRRVEFVGSGGDLLAAKLDAPTGPVRAFGIFAHCFTCSKDLFAAQRIAFELAPRGIAILRQCEFSIAPIHLLPQYNGRVNLSTNPPTGDLSTHNRPP
jgi:hypothetical protein